MFHRKTRPRVSLFAVPALLDHPDGCKERQERQERAKLGQSRYVVLTDVKRCLKQMPQAD